MTPLSPLRGSQRGPLRGAIAGFGFIAENGHLPGYRSRTGGGRELEIVAVADVCGPRRERARSLLPNARIYDDVRSLLAAEKDKLDFVDVATPPSEHAAITHLALDQGLHVLCEKPLATSPQDARSMLDHALRARRVLYPCHNYKHAPVIRTVRKALDEDAIGKVHLVTLQTFRNTHARGVKEWRADWRRERRWSGGGIAMDHGSHTFYLAFDWLGAYPTSITAKMSQMAMPGTAPGAVVDADTEDNFSCAMTFPGGATASAHLTWTAGIRRVLYTLHGSKGAIRVEDDDVEVARMRTSGGETAWDVEKQKVASEWMNTGHGAWFASMLDRFAKTLDEGDFAGREAQASLRCVELIATAYASARAGSRELPLPSGAPASGERHLPDYQTAP